MTAVIVVLVSVAGGFGAVARLLLDGVISAARPEGSPVGTAVINLSGSLALGLVAGLSLRYGPADWQLVLGTGFLGGYTTFSTASFHTVRLIQQRQPATALLHGFGVLLACVALAGLGLWAGSH